MVVPKLPTLTITVQIEDRSVAEDYFTRLSESFDLDKEQDLSASTSPTELSAVVLSLLNLQRSTIDIVSTSSPVEADLSAIEKNIKKGKREQSDLEDLEKMLDEIGAQVRPNRSSV